MSAPLVPPDTLVLGLGNRFGGDDALGPLVAERLAARLPGLAVVEGAPDALAIVAAWEGFARVIVVDAATGGSAPGTVHRLDTTASLAPKALASCSSHGGGLLEALALAEAIGRPPPALVLYAVELGSLEPGTGLSPAVAATLHALVERIVLELGGARAGAAATATATPRSRRTTTTTAAAAAAAAAEDAPCTKPH